MNSQLLSHMSYESLIKPHYTIAHKFDDDTCYHLWPIRFSTEQEAADWIKLNHPNSIIKGDEWVVIEVQGIH